MVGLGLGLKAKIFGHAGPLLCGLVNSTGEMLANEAVAAEFQQVSSSNYARFYVVFFAKILGMRPPVSPSPLHP